jgi:hypothetical protein
MDLTEIARLMEANLLQVFNERDLARRREVIAHTYTADVRWTDDDGTVDRPDRVPSLRAPRRTPPPLKHRHPTHQPTSATPLRITLVPTRRIHPKHMWVTVLHSPQAVTDLRWF